MNDPVFVFAFKEDLNPDIQSRLEAAFAEFFSNWKAHGQALAASLRVLENRFLWVSVDPGLAEASGCSKDTLFRFANRLFGELGVAQEDAGRFFVEIQPDQIVSLSMAQLRERIRIGDLDPEARMFPTWFPHKSELEENWGRPIHRFAGALRLELAPTNFSK